MLIARGSYYYDGIAGRPAVSPIKENVASAEDDPYAGLTQIIVVQNWLEELKRRVPVN
jgi:hypothetical protein